METMISLNMREKRRTSAKSTGSMMAWGHRRAAFIMPMADPTPNWRAG